MQRLGRPRRSNLGQVGMQPLEGLSAKGGCLGARWMHTGSSRLPGRVVVTHTGSERTVKTLHAMSPERISVSWFSHSEEALHCLSRKYFGK